jgi:hypothetical protein
MEEYLETNRKEIASEMAHSWERESGPNKIASTGSRKHDKVVNCDVNLVQEEEEWCTVY